MASLCKITVPLFKAEAIMIMKLNVDTRTSRFIITHNYLCGLESVYLSK